MPPWGSPLLPGEEVFSLARETEARSRGPALSLGGADPNVLPGRTLLMCVRGNRALRGTQICALGVLLGWAQAGTQTHADVPSSCTDAARGRGQPQGEDVQIPLLRASTQSQQRAGHSHAARPRTPPGHPAPEASKLRPPLNPKTETP